MDRDLYGVINGEVKGYMVKTAKTLPPEKKLEV